MEDEEEFDLEVIRLKRLLEAKILQVEKENLEIIRNGLSDCTILSNNIQVPRNQPELPSTSSLVTNQRSARTCGKSAHSMKSNVKSCSHVSQSMKHPEGTMDNRSPHSNVHFINRLEQSLIMGNMKKRVLQNEAKSRYIHCAVPLSPPIRIKKEDNLTFLDDSENNTTSVKNVHNSPKPQVISNKKLNIQTLPGITIPGENVKFISAFEKKTTNETINPSCERSVPFTKDFSGNMSDTLPKEIFVSPRVFPSIGTLDNNSFSWKGPSQGSTENYIPKPGLANNASEVEEENCGFKLHVSLDSCSTKDVVNKFLQRIPDFLNKTEVTDNNANKLSSEDQKCRDNPQLVHEIPLNAAIINEKLTKQIITVSSSTQTDSAMHESSDRQPELHILVKDIVLDTLKNLHYPEFLSHTKSVSTCLKVDRGIQSEIESDVGDLNENVQFSGSGALLKEGNKQSVGVSTGVQVSMNSIQIPEQRPISYQNDNVHIEDSNKDSFHQVINLCVEDKIVSDRATLTEPSHRVESMIEKIYEHVCQEKDVSNSTVDEFERCPIITREVGVQFNPIHTSTKSTLTSEIRTMDSSAQYDIPSIMNTAQKSFTNTAIQASDFADECNDNPCLQLNAYTQCETKTFRDCVIQTDVLSSELVVSNTSLSSTPVSDIMFMDDLLSEGEMALPWNLRLLSCSGGGGGGGTNMNNTDSSDISSKEKDYSLSEGEMPPNILRYFHTNYSSSVEENGMHPDYHHTKFMTDSKNPNTSRNDAEKYSGNRIAHGRDPQHLISSSSLSEGEVRSNMSLPPEDIPSGFSVPLAESSRISDVHPSYSTAQGCDNIHCDLPSVDHAQERDTLNSYISNGKVRDECANDNANVCNLSHVLLQTVEEETHSFFE